ncbi:MAG: alpha/beta hydrolase, partial [Hyphomicrobiales bacterium]|nr:alpha/beta hydrolase [Hyphomicrobiales bacterium]
MATSADTIDRHRRRFIRAALALAAARLALNGSALAQAQSASLADVEPGRHTSFAPLKQIDAGVLNVGDAEAGPDNGPPVILLHGWPYDIHSFVDVAPALATAGFR